MERRFTRLRRGPTGESPGASDVPDDGMCLSVFLVLSSPESAGAVLMGRLEPSAAWPEIGALDAARAMAVGDRWMLPSSQLVFFESPEDGARRILKEQLGSAPIPLDGPAVFSEAYRRPGSPAADPHWDLHFVFRGRWPSSTPPRAPAWRALEFVDVRRTDPASIARNQGDVLALVGLPPRGARRDTATTRPPRPTAPERTRRR
jgi:ADP-ribose pyrophosphatase YjhB (NUDIX family)